MPGLRCRFFYLCSIAAMALAAPQLLAETYQYDSAGRLIGVAYDSGLLLRYSYDANGNILSATTVEQLLFANGFE